MVCEIAHFGYNRAKVCIMIHRQFSVPIRKSSYIHSSTNDDQNHKNPSTSSTLLSHFYRGGADLSPSVEPAEWLQHTTQSEHFE